MKNRNKNDEPRTLLTRTSNQGHQTEEKLYYIVLFRIIAMVLSFKYTQHRRCDRSSVTPVFFSICTGTQMGKKSAGMNSYSSRCRIGQGFHDTWPSRALAQTQSGDITPHTNTLEREFYSQRFGFITF